MSGNMLHRKGVIRVEQLHGKQLYRRDVDAEEWSYHWLKLDNGVVILLMSHDADP